MICKDCIYFWQDQDAHCSEGNCCRDPEYRMRDATMPACEPMMREAMNRAAQCQCQHSLPEEYKDILVRQEPYPGVQNAVW